ncbi:F-box protein CPR1-like [Silene latifolia]|uniref:F-box protein CPR1-like n=1 Tax=Silene latifolia TaxID=37657 RepID=UPI003D7807D6
METGVPPTNRYPTLSKLGRHRHNSHSSLSQEPRVDHKAKDKVINDLPREVIFDILRFLPAKLLYEVVRYVCKQWYDIVSDPSFVRAHYQMTTTTTTTTASYLVQSYLNQDSVYCADQDGAKSVKVTEIHLPFKAKIQGSCNGFILLSDYRDKRMVHVMNPVTKLIHSLPPVAPGISYGFAVNSSGQYKVGRFSFLDYHQGYKMSMFTIGVDKAWRSCIEVQDHQGIPLTFGNTFHTINSCGILIAGFMYWCNIQAVSIAMDVDTETLYQISWPTDPNTKFDEGQFISMGTALGLMAKVNKLLVI